MPIYTERLRSLVERCTPRLLALSQAARATRPSPDKWSPAEVLGHLVDSASNNHGRFVLGQLRDSLEFPGYDQDAWVSIQGYATAPWEELVTLWSTFNLHLARVMESAPEEVRTRPRSQHNLQVIAWRDVPADRPTTLDTLMDDYVAHLEHHLRQVLGPELGL